MKSPSQSSSNEKTSRFNVRGPARVVLSPTSESRFDAHREGVDTREPIWRWCRGRVSMSAKTRTTLAKPDSGGAVEHVINYRNDRRGEYETRFNAPARSAARVYLLCCRRCREIEMRLVAIPRARPIPVLFSQRARIFYSAALRSLSRGAARPFLAPFDIAVSLHKIQGLHKTTLRAPRPRARTLAEVTGNREEKTRERGKKRERESFVTTGGTVSSRHDRTERDF